MKSNFDIFVIALDVYIGIMATALVIDMIVSKFKKKGD